MLPFLFNNTHWDSQSVSDNHQQLVNIKRFAKNQMDTSILGHSQIGFGRNRPSSRDCKYFG
ncbi:MAG: hypothetical protein PHT92_07460 [Bacteroidales bacterium]|nr:hypothetical protein [Bacteroidales bacterium]